jgi:hypothetical protein
MNTTQHNTKAGAPADKSARLLRGVTIVALLAASFWFVLRFVGQINEMREESYKALIAAAHIEAPSDREPALRKVDGLADTLNEGALLAFAIPFAWGWWIGAKVKHWK